MRHQISDEEILELFKQPQKSLLACSTSKDERKHLWQHINICDGGNHAVEFSVTNNGGPPKFFAGLREAVAYYNEL